MVAPADLSVATGRRVWRDNLDRKSVNQGIFRVFGAAEGDGLGFG
jgi:hypothetical protein